VVEVYLEGNGFSAAAGVGGLAILVARAEGALTTGAQRDTEENLSLANPPAADESAEKLVACRGTRAMTTGAMIKT